MVDASTGTGLQLLLILHGTFLATAFFSEDRTETNRKMDPNGLFPTTSTRHVKNGLLPLPVSPLPQDVTVIESDALPTNPSYTPEIGNGHIATVVGSDSMFMNGLYNGANYSSHRARVPSSVGFSISSTTPSTGLGHTFTLDVGRGFFMESHSGDCVTISLRTYAHRVWTYVIVSELILTRNDTSKDVMVTIVDNQGPGSDDIHFYDETDSILRGVTNVAEYPEIAPTTQFYVKASSLKGQHSLEGDLKSQTIVAFTSIGVDRQKVLDHYDKAVEALTGGTLLTSHVREWEKVWSKGRVDVEGDNTIARINYAALYYLYSSLPFNGSDDKAWPFIGLSPGGLAHGVNEDDYGGHVFWDQDTWMFPGLTLLNADFGRLMVGTRTRTLDSAKILAKATGFQGARYPWESAFTGLETCPGPVYADLEIHITGDVVMMLRQYWELTGDSHFFLDGRGYEVVQQACAFFASRVTYRQSDDTYHINKVMPPDEYNHPVDDSVYTNVIAAAAFRFANNISSIFGRPENKTWAAMADKLVVEYDAQLDYHPEFAGYRHGSWTKQADVVMLSYPLMFAMKNSTRINDLTQYEKTTPIGPAPAMTWSIFLINWLEIGNETKAAELFKRSILNAQEPFYVWSENSDGSGATNFLTGMGGHLHAILFGYGGCRVFPQSLFFNPKMIPGTTKVSFTSIDYMNNSFDMYFTDTEVSITLTATQTGHNGLEIRLSKTGTWTKLIIGQEVKSQRQSFDLMKSKN